MFDKYTILENDTYDNVASKFNISTALLKSINNNADFKPGNIILVPKYSNNIYCCANFLYFVVQLFRMSLCMFSYIH